MSSDISDGELTDALLDLVDTSEKKKKRRRPSSGSKPVKRHKRETMQHSDSEDEPESEEDASNPYPLDGKYKDEADRQRIMQLPEIEREELLSRRADELQRFQDRNNLSILVKAQSGGGGDVTVSSAAKRKHTARGATKEKADKLSEYKAKRKAKDERRKVDRDKTSPRRGSSSDDMEISSDDEDGEINKDQQLEERARQAFDKSVEPEAKIALIDIQKIQLTRETLSRHSIRPWFEDYVKGAFVRYLIGQDGGEPVYRLCEITNMGPDLVKPYKVDDQMVNQLLELRHGKHVKCFAMDKVSNALVNTREFERYIKTHECDKVPLPTKRQLEKKNSHLQKLAAQALTESDVAAMIARKNNMQPSRVHRQQTFTEKIRLQQERKLALAREDIKEAEAIEVKIKALEEVMGTSDTLKREEEVNDAMAKVNERNRQRNLELVRKAEHEQALKRKLERKALASGAATPTNDPSARLKILPKLFSNRSRGGTPADTSTPTLTPSAVPAADGSVSPIPPLSMPRSVTTATPKLTKTDFESKMLNVEIDLGDF